MNENDHFHLREYAALREEIVSTQRQVSEILRFALLSIALLISWLLFGPVRAAEGEFRDNDPTVLFIAGWIPFIAAWFFSAYTSDLRRTIRNIAVYIRQIEDRYASQELGGWEHRTSLEELKKGRRSRSSARNLFIFMNLAAFIFGIYFDFLHSQYILKLITEVGDWIVGIVQGLF